jgi:hypothetical protein
VLLLPNYSHGTRGTIFFSHFDKSSEKQRGVDTTVHLALLEVNKAKATFKEAGFGDTSSMTGPHYVYQAPTQTPPAPKPSAVHSSLAGGPSVWSHSFTGRASAVTFAMMLRLVTSIYEGRLACCDKSVDELSIYHKLNECRPDSGRDPTDGRKTSSQKPNASSSYPMRVVIALVTSSQGPKTLFRYLWCPINCNVLQYLTWRPCCATTSILVHKGTGFVLLRFIQQPTIALAKQPTQCQGNEVDATSHRCPPVYSRSPPHIWQERTMHSSSH